MKRRSFLRGMMGAGIVVGSNIYRMPLAGAATSGGLCTLVVIFQRGGCDGLNTVVPYADPDYYSLRPSIAVAPPNPADPAAALNLDNFFGLHPSLSPLMPIFSAGDLAILPTVHYQNATRSHFSGQDYMESGAPQSGLDGWLNRHLQLSGAVTPLQAVHFGGSLSKALRGNIPVQSFSFIDSFHSGLNSADENALVNHVLPIYGEDPAAATNDRFLVHDYGNMIFNNLNIISGIDTANYIPENGAVYPSGSYGRRLKETAQLIKQGVGLEVATIDIGGWDTHSNQGAGEAGGRQAKRFAEFAQGIGAFYTDLGNSMQDVILLTMTEFGRTAKENGSAGTDHGNAASWFAVGKNIQGGIYGAWPGLRDVDLYNGRYLQHTVDYRDILGDILINHLGHNTADLGFLLPGHGYSTLNLI